MTQNNYNIKNEVKKQASTAGYIALGVIFLMGVLIGALPSIVAAVKPLVCGG